MARGASSDGCRPGIVRPGPVFHADDLLDESGHPGRPITEAYRVVALGLDRVWTRD